MTAGSTVSSKSNGGSVSVTSGYSSYLSSGNVFLQTANSGTLGELI